MCSSDLLLYTLDMAIGVVVTALLLMLLKPNLENKDKKTEKLSVTEDNKASVK